MKQQRQQYLEVFVQIDPKDLQNDVNGWLEAHKDTFEVIAVNFSLGNGEYGCVIQYHDSLPEQSEDKAKGK